MARAPIAALALLLLASCNPSAPSAAPPAAHPAASVSEQAVAPAGEPCGATTCTPPERCITVVGMAPPGASHTQGQCWIPCGEGDKCPAGMKCTMISDGPGKVCE